jgi:hypothetical protein
MGSPMQDAINRMRGMSATDVADAEREPESRPGGKALDRLLMFLWPPSQGIRGEPGQVGRPDIHVPILREVVAMEREVPLPHTRSLWSSSRSEARCDRSDPRSRVDTRPPLEEKLMYSLFRLLPWRRLVQEQLPAFAIAFTIAEMFYKFHSFSLETLAFLVTWAAIDAAIQGVRRAVAGTGRAAIDGFRC